MISSATSEWKHNIMTRPEQGEDRLGDCTTAHWAREKLIVGVDRYLWEICRDSFPTPCCKTHWTNKERAQCQQGTHHCSTDIPSYNMILWQAKLLRGPQQRDKEAPPAGGWWRSVSWLLASIIMTPPPAAATPGHVPRDTCCSVRGGNRSRLYYILFPELQRLDNKYRKHNICIM